MAREAGEAVDEGEIDLRVDQGHGAPVVPRQHLAVVERGHVANDVAGDEPEACHVQDPEGLRIGLAIAAQAPCVAGHQEPVARHLQRVEVDVEQGALTVVDLGIGQDPPPAGFVEVLRHPVVDELALREVGAEPAARPGRDPFAAEHRDVQQRVVAAAARETLAGQAGLRQRPRILDRDPLQDLFRAPYMRLAPLVLRKRDAVGLRQVLVDEQTLQDLCKPARIGRQRAEL